MLSESEVGPPDSACEPKTLVPPMLSNVESAELESSSLMVALS